MELKHKAENIIDYSKDELNKVLLDLAQSELDYIETKKYDVAFKLHADESIKIGVGVYASGNCLALIKPR
jgi:hypothetical protein